ncbi:unnamed protein product [Symbiodinium natans]|uniref:PARP catalytic domain-containing protein n=1 Tax=Symbiodinium natans TaxID=878477 RepID=A0A812KB52_9DINO|nr:unnamed protein product [Symbiodinium natans]
MAADMMPGFHKLLSAQDRSLHLRKEFVVRMGNVPTTECPNCNGTGAVTSPTNIPIVVRAFAGGILGASLGPGGMVIGAAGAALMDGTVTTSQKCSQCNGRGKVEVDKSRKVQHASRTPSGWHRQGGKTMKMYHGTTAANAQSILENGFKPSSNGMLGKGVYVSADIEKAKRYGHSVLEVEAKLGKTKKIDSQSHPMRTSWHSHGYDSAWVPANCGMVSSGLTETCIFDPDRIRVIREV